MAKVLLIKTSMTEKTEKGSISTTALHSWTEFYKKKNPNDKLIKLNLNIDPVGQQVLTSENMKTYWDNADKYINQLKDVDKVVIATPMTNFNYPAPLKNYLDHILLAGKTFKYKYDGKGESEGLLKHLKVLLITSQGAPKGWYPFGDHTISLTGTWKFVGAKVVEPVIIGGTKTKELMPLTRQEVVAKHIDEIKKSAQMF